MKTVQCSTHRLSWLSLQLKKFVYKLTDFFNIISKTVLTFLKVEMQLKSHPSKYIGPSYLPKEAEDGFFPLDLPVYII